MAASRGHQFGSVDLRGKHWVTLGTKGAGKSHFNKALIQAATGRVVIFDPMDEYPDYDNVYRVEPNNRRGDKAVEELQKTTEWVEYNKEKIDYFIVDEISRFHQKRGLLDDSLGELIDLNRHWNIGVGFIARRPTQLHTDIREMADYLFIFSLRGANDLAMLDNIAEGLQATTRDMVQNHPQHSFVVVEPDRNYYISPPI